MTNYCEENKVLNPQSGRAAQKCQGVTKDCCHGK